MTARDAATYAGQMQYAVPPRRRGRPRRGERDDTRQVILSAAVEEFGELGYDAATIRGIAGRANVDAALIHHYFGTKADLFGATVDAPMRPDREVPLLLDGPRDQLGERIVRYVLESWEEPATRKRGTLIMRAAIGNRLTAPLLAGFLSRELLSRIADSLEAEDATLRASLVASQIAGLIVTRYILELPALRDASVDELVTRVGATVQRYLVDP